MHVRFTKGPVAGSDAVECIRPDGTATSMAMERRGVLPHEACHFVVETTLAWRDAFFGQVSRGGSLEQVTAMLHERKTPWTKITQALQSEALVECLQAEQWGGAADPVLFAQNLMAACRRRGVAPPDITLDEVERVRVALRTFGATWRPLSAGAVLDRDF